MILMHGWNGGGTRRESGFIHSLARDDSGWLGLKDSKLDFQNQNLTSYQLDEAPPRCVFQRRQLNTRPAGRLDRPRTGTHFWRLDPVTQVS
jgi:hypothetical protein